MNKLSPLQLHKGQGEMDAHLQSNKVEGLVSVGKLISVSKEITHQKVALLLPVSDLGTCSSQVQCYTNCLSVQTTGLLPQ
jgi:hypothetical protein